MKTLIFYNQEGLFQLPAICWNVKKTFEKKEIVKNIIKVENTDKETKKSKPYIEKNADIELVNYIKETDNDFLNRIGKKDCTDGYNYKIINSEDIPKELCGKLYKNGKFIEDKEYKISCIINELKPKRNKKLKELDIEFMIAYDIGDDKKRKEVSKHRQQLRGMPTDPKWKTEDNYIPDYI